MFEVIYGGVKNSYLEIRRIGHICENQRIHIHCFLIPMEWDSVILILKESSKIKIKVQQILNGRKKERNCVKTKCIEP